ncbi:MAG: CDP-alcohol phosphatidyltransferase family protein [Candidatus Melainabacteria bacterium]|nr:CDP-alcohol phosphatidyltransferase family protein [Candidatus Melainabacteria bacterium]
MNYFTIPNLICCFRILLAFYAFSQFLQDADQIKFLILTIAVIVLDGLDGIIARKLNQCTEFGAKLDIVADRIIELAYWFFFGFLGLIPYWVFGFYLIRGLAVDYVSMQSTKPLGDSWLRSSQFMRGFYGALKLLSFALLIMLPDYLLMGFNLATMVVYLTVLVCALRALPVFM